jgi:hypothetical protein
MARADTPGPSGGSLNHFWEALIAPRRTSLPFHKGDVATAERLRSSRPWTIWHNSATQSVHSPDNPTASTADPLTRATATAPIRFLAA